MAPSISVNDAAERLGISPRAVRLQIESGTLPAVKFGRDWQIDERALASQSRKDPGPGRRLSPAMAWAVLMLASGEGDRADGLLRQPRYRSRARRWLREHPLEAHPDRLGDRSESQRFEAHPSELPRLRGRRDVLYTGESAAQLVGLASDALASVEFYAPSHSRASIAREHGLIEGPGPVLIRWVPDEIWSALDVSESTAPRAAVLVDLLESDDPRARREATRRLTT